MSKFFVLMALVEHYKLDTFLILPKIHPAETSIVSDICDLSKISDIAPLTMGSMEKSFFYHLFCITHKIDFSKDFWEIYV